MACYVCIAKTLILECEADVACLFGHSLVVRMLVSEFKGNPPDRYVTKRVIHLHVNRMTWPQMGVWTLYRC